MTDPVEDPIPQRIVHALKPWFQLRRPFSDNGFTDYTVIVELADGPVDLLAGRKPSPVVVLDAFPFAIDRGFEELAAQQVGN